MLTASPAITVDPRIQQWIAPLRPDELALLEASVRAEGCRDALIAWNETLIDGHHRFAICQQNDIPYRVTPLEFPDIDHVEVWVRRNQAGRRNLTDDQRAMNAALQLEAESRIAKRLRSRIAVDARERKAGRSPILAAAVVAEIEARHRLRDPRTERLQEKAAKDHGVSERRIRRATAVKTKAPKLAGQISSGAVTLKEAEKAIRDSDRAARRSDAAASAKTSPAAVDSTIRHESFTDAATSLDEGSVALVFTDPPYHDKTIGVYADLGTVAARVLKDGGSLITYTSHHRIPEVIAMLQAAGLTFFWPIAMVHNSPPYARMTEYGIVVRWKPLLWFVKGKFRSRDDLRFVDDLVESGKEKGFHPWQQSVVEARYYIEGLTQPGDLVFDPFCGGGTTAVAAVQTTRRWLTCDVDEEAVWIARARVREAVDGQPE